MGESVRTDLTDTPASAHQDMKETIANGTSMIVMKSRATRKMQHLYQNVKTGPIPMNVPATTIGPVNYATIPPIRALLEVCPTMSCIITPEIMSKN